MDYRLAKPEWKDLKDPPKYNQWKCSGCKILFWDSILNRKFLEGLHWLHWKTSFLVLSEPAVNCSLNCSDSLPFRPLLWFENSAAWTVEGAKDTGHRRKQLCLLVDSAGLFQMSQRVVLVLGLQRNLVLGYIYLLFLGHVLNKSQHSHEGARM